MLLVVDVGNTQTHLGTFQGEKLSEHWRFATVRQSTADELGAALHALLELRGMSFADIDASIVSSTVPQLGPQWSEMATRYLGHHMPVVGPGVKTGMAIRLDNPRELGADRLVNAVAAHHRVGGPCIIVDFGTAITYDAVSAEAEYLGGIIAPGVEISMEALTERAAALPRIDLGEPRSLIGHSTVDAIRSGVIFGFAGDGGRDRRPPARRAGRGDPHHRHRRPGAAHRALLHVDRRDRRPAHAHGPAPDPRAQPLIRLNMRGSCPR